ncbi:hypothetical protein Droror1_Dr00008667 [Drosera rotundifolia]
MATKSKIYFVMEFVCGDELFNKVAKGRLKEDVARKYFQQLVPVVGFCHARGVYHRDLKPENKDCVFGGFGSCPCVVLGFERDGYIGSTLVEMYVARGDMGCARKVFNKMPERDTVVGTGMVDGYGKAGEVEEAWKVFEGMRERNEVTWSVMMVGRWFGCLGGCRMRVLELGMLSSAIMHLRAWNASCWHRAHLNGLQRMRFSSPPHSNLNTISGVLGVGIVCLPQFDFRFVVLCLFLGMILNVILLYDNLGFRSSTRPYVSHYSRGRVLVTKASASASMLDDTYDAYATFEELRRLTDAFERWEMNDEDQLSDYLKVVFNSYALSLMNLIKRWTRNDGRIPLVMLERP